MRRSFALIVLSTSLAACASGGDDYPSLAIRDAERMTGDAAPVEAARPVERTALSTDTATRVAQLGTLGQATHAKFAEVETRTARLVAAARGTAITTKPNASAQIALAELQSAHDATLAILAELDVLFAEATLSISQLEAISSARDEMAALAESEQASLARLSAQMPSQ